MLSNHRVTQPKNNIRCISLSSCKKLSKLKGLNVDAGIRQDVPISKVQSIATTVGFENFTS